MIRHDLHTHTHYSDGVPKPAEMVEEASAKELEVLAITDHGPEIDVGIDRDDIWKMIDDVRRAEKDAVIRVLLGMEANVLDSSGNIDVEDELLAELDILLAGVHELRGVSPSQDLAEAYLERVTNCVRDFPVDVLVHPFWFYEELSQHLGRDTLEDFGKILRDTGTIVEISEKYRVPCDRLLEIFEGCGVRFCLGSDSHSLLEIGRNSWGESKLKGLGDGEDLLGVNDLV